MIIQVGGIGYEVHIPLTTSEKLPALRKEIKLYTQAVYREDAQTLYGFSDRESRDFFRMIVDKVSGIGPKIALNLLGSLSLPTLKTSIASGDVGMLSKAQGLGKKTAERVVVELKDKVLPKGTTIEAAPVSSAGAMERRLRRIQRSRSLSGCSLRPAHPRLQSNRSRPSRAQGSGCAWPRSNHRGTDQKGPRTLTAVHPVGNVTSQVFTSLSYGIL